MYSEICQKFATKLQELRSAKGLTQEHLALDADVDKSYIGKIENGQKMPTLKTIAKLALALDVHVRELFDFDYKIK